MKTPNLFLLAGGAAAAWLLFFRKPASAVAGHRQLPPLGAGPVPAHGAAAGRQLSFAISRMAASTAPPETVAQTGAAVLREVTRRRDELYQRLWEVETENTPEDQARRRVLTDRALTPTAWIQADQMRTFPNATGMVTF